jgi:hypothetical protein
MSWFGVTVFGRGWARYQWIDFGHSVGFIEIQRFYVVYK